MNWLASMEQTFEYYIVDPETWTDKEMIDNVISSSIARDYNSKTLYSASINSNNELDECYIRIYLVATQKGITEKYALGTFLIQTPSTSYDGRVQKITIDAYSPLIELKDNMPPIGYTILKGINIMDAASSLCEEKMRAPVTHAKSDKTMYNDFVANLDDSWLTFVSDLVQYAEFELYLDEMGRLLFAPKQDTSALQPVWTYNDDNSSILYPDISVERDLYGIPNVVEVVYSVTNSLGNTESYLSRVVNDDQNSLISTVSRGREVLTRITDASFPGPMSKEDIDEYAKNQLRKLSTLEYSVSYTHGYCPVRVGDCVYLNYTRAGLNNIKARVINQTIECESGCKVTETATYTIELWEG